MPGVTQPMERPGTYKQSFDAVKEQMMKHPKYSKLFTPDEISVMVKQSLIQKAEDKIEFMLRGEMRRKKLEKKGISEDEYRALLKKRLMEQDGYPFTLSEKEQKTADEIKERVSNMAIEEKTNMTASALKKILSEA